MSNRCLNSIQFGPSLSINRLKGIELCFGNHDEVGFVVVAVGVEVGLHLVQNQPLLG